MGDQVFVSYDRTDQTYVDRLVRLLVNHGLMAWHDTDLPAGEPFSRVIQREIDKSAAMVVIMTPASMESAWVDSEIHYAMQRKVPIVPVMLVDCEVLLPLVRMNYVDVTDGSLPGDDFLRNLRSQVERGVEVPEKAPPLSGRVETQESPAPPEEVSAFATQVSRGSRFSAPAFTLVGVLGFCGCTGPFLDSDELSNFLAAVIVSVAGVGLIAAYALFILAFFRRSLVIDANGVVARRYGETEGYAWGEIDRVDIEPIAALPGLWPAWATTVVRWWPPWSSPSLLVSPTGPRMRLAKRRENGRLFRKTGYLRLCPISGFDQDELAIRAALAKFGGPRYEL